MAFRNAALTSGMFRNRNELPDEADTPRQHVLRRALARWRRGRRSGRVGPARTPRQSQQSNVNELVNDMARRSRMEEAAARRDAPRSLRQRLWALFDDPDSSTPAYFLQAWIVVLILISAVVFCVQTVASQEDVFAWTVLEYFVVINFTIEFVVRVVTCPSKKDFVLSAMNWVDFLAILPFYVELVIKSINSSSNIGGLAVIRVIRLARVLRLFKLGKHSEQFSLVFRATRKSKEGIVLLFFMLGIAVVFFSAAMYYAEVLDCYQADDGVWYYKGGSETAENRSPYQSIVHTFWWTIVTLVTVGYGDDVPRTTQGKIVAAACMITGILVLAFPITLLGASFGEVYAETKEQKIRRKIAGIHRVASKVLSKKRKMSIPQLCRLYREISRDVNDAIGETRDSYLKIIRALEYYQMATLELQQIVQAIVVAYELDLLERGGGVEAGTAGSGSGSASNTQHPDEESVEMEELLRESSSDQPDRPAAAAADDEIAEHTKAVINLFVRRFRARQTSESSSISSSPATAPRQARHVPVGAAADEDETAETSRDPLILPNAVSP